MITLIHSIILRPSTISGINTKFYADNIKELVYIVHNYRCERYFCIEVFPFALRNIFIKSQFFLWFKIVNFEVKL